MAIILATGLIWLVWPESTPPPPVLEFVDMEPVQVIDNSGEDLCLVNSILRRTDYRAPEWKVRYFKDAGKPIEAKIRDQWQEAKGTSARLTSIRNDAYECQFLLPVGAERCRVWLKYAGPKGDVTLKSAARYVAIRLPQIIRSKILPRNFWRWVGFPNSGPSEHWREVCVELALPAVTNAITTEGSTRLQTSKGQ